MTIKISIDGQVLTDFSQASVFRSVQTISGGFSFTASPQVGVPYPIQNGSVCQILIGDVPVIDGFVEEVSVDYGPGAHEIAVTGRDKTADLIDSSVGPAIDLKGPISLKSVCETTLAAMGLSAIQVFDLSGGIDPFTADEVVSAEVDMGGFDFLESFAIMRQVFLTTDGLGNIQIVRAGTVRALSGLQNSIQNPEFNNIESAGLQNSLASRFNRIDVVTQLAPAGLGDNDQPSATVATQQGFAVDTDIRTTRRLFIQAEECGSSEIATQRAAWEANTRRAQSLQYRATVAGLFQDAQETTPWAPNQIVNVNDDFADVHANMLIWTVESRFDQTGGSTTQLTCAPPDALSLTVTEPVAQKNTDPVGGDFG